MQSAIPSFLLLVLPLEDTLEDLDLTELTVLARLELLKLLTESVIYLVEEDTLWKLLESRVESGSSMSTDLSTASAFLLALTGC